MDFHKMIMEGKFQCEKGTSLPNFYSSDESRLFYLENIRKLYLNNGTEWIMILDDGDDIDADTLEGYSASDFAISSHEHTGSYDSRYLRQSNNLSELTNVESVWSNLGITDYLDKIINWTIAYVSYTAESFGGYFLEGGITIYLPASPSFEDVILFSPIENLEENNVIINRNGNKLLEVEENLIIDLSLSFGLVFGGIEEGWLLIN